MKKNYSITYPEGVWSLYGSLSDCDIWESEDLPMKEDILIEDWAIDEEEGKQ